jgi:hypothetical protein
MSLAGSSLIIRAWDIEKVVLSARHIFAVRTTMDSSILIREMEAMNKENPPAGPHCINRHFVSQSM